MGKSPLAGLAVATFALTGCYHATIDTGLEPSARVYEKSFASSWVYGLVPPDLVEAGAECPNGISRVETQLTFVNQLVGFLTLGIYTPMSIKVTCAASMRSSTAIDITTDIDNDDLQQTFTDAANLSMAERRPVFVKMQ